MKLMNKILVGRAKERVTEIAAADVHASKGATMILIDVRETEEFNEGHIDGAINIPRGVIEFQIRAHPRLAGAETDPGAPVYLYCVSSARSGMAAVTLMDVGFEHVYSMAGGITAWREAGLPVADGG